MEEKIIQSRQFVTLESADAKLTMDCELRPCCTRYREHTLFTEKRGLELQGLWRPLDEKNKESLDIVFNHGQRRQVNMQLLSSFPSLFVS
jgi:hypothetical protein